MPNQNDIRQAITNQIIAALESGSVPPWRRPWRLGKNAGAPANVVSKRSYRGLNPILLDLACEKHGFSSKWWGDLQPVETAGRQGDASPRSRSSRQMGHSDRLLEPVTKKVQNEHGDLEDDRFFVLRLYTVFNVDQVEGLDHLRAGQPDTGEPLAIDYQPADEALEAATCRHGHQPSLWRREGRSTTRPGLHSDAAKATFESLTSTTPPSSTNASRHGAPLPARLVRKDREHAYALGELIAELGGVFVCRELGVPRPTISTTTRLTSPVGSMP